tara:strand:- start:264 stop:455 length:192 start_codon:yes stop_codon:yes gene_type:complete
MKAKELRDLLIPLDDDADILLTVETEEDDSEFRSLEHVEYFYTKDGKEYPEQATDHLVLRILN